MRRRAIANASRSLTRTQRSIADASYVPGKKSSPTPSVRYGRAVSPDRTDPSGSAPITWMAGFRALSTWAAPEIVPPVPTLATKWVIRPSGLVPQLGAGRPLMGRRVLHVPVLIGLERAGDVARQPRRHAVVRRRRLRRDVRGAQDDFRAIRTQQGLLLDRLLVGHHEDAAIALEGGRDGQAVAGVAARRLDDRAARLEQALALGRFDHRQPDAVLDRPARVEHLHLRQQERLSIDGAEVAGDPADPDERRVADQIQDGLGVLHRRGV